MESRSPTVMETLIVGFSRPRTWKPFSWLIMTAYRTPFSHAYIKFYSKSLDRWIIYQASSTMVNFMNVETFNEEDLVVYETQIEISQEEKSQIIRFAMDNCGKPYGIKEIFGIAWVRLQELTINKETSNSVVDGDKTFFCSELVARILAILGYALPKPPESMSPKDVYDLVRKEKVIATN